jgi:hypothetical protein
MMILLGRSASVLDMPATNAAAMTPENVGHGIDALPLLHQLTGQIANLFPGHKIDSIGGHGFPFPISFVSSAVFFNNGLPCFTPAGIPAEHVIHQ